MAKVVLVVTGIEVGGWPGAGKRDIPGSVPSKHCLSKRQTWGTAEGTA